MVTWNAIQEIIVKFTHNQYEVFIDVYAIVLKNKRNDKMNHVIIFFQDLWNTHFYYSMIGSMLSFISI